MRSYLKALKIAGIAGALVGAAVGARECSWVWPRLSLAVMLKPLLIGWAVGIAVSPIVGWALSRAVGHSRPPPQTRWRRAASGLVFVLAALPAAVWLTAALPNSVARRAFASGRRPGDARPNIIVITIDALRADHVGAYGSTDGLTPNIDAFAREATRYDRAYVSSPWTLTSFGAMFTGRPPSRCGLRRPEKQALSWYMGAASLPRDVPLVWGRLRRAGYVTAAEITNPFLASKRGWSRGFDDFRNEDDASSSNKAQTVTDHALVWLRLNRKAPFFFWVHYLDPHEPYRSPDTPQELQDQYPRGWLAEQGFWRAQVRGEIPAVRERYQGFCRAMYAAEVRYADKWVGELLGAVKGAGLWDDSLVVISADHGEELFDRGGFGHGHSLYAELLRVPLLVKWPAGTEADDRISGLVGLIDLEPTLLQVAGIASPEGSEGSAWPRRESAGRAEVYSEGVLYGREHTALTTRGYKVIYRPYAEKPEQEYEVYDLAQDPGELNDLSNTEAAEALRRRLKTLTAEADAAVREFEAEGKPRVRLDEKTRRSLESLGYVGE
jgi:arylsulfatase A-like enzyme